jgi:hypothetical protein
VNVNGNRARHETTRRKRRRVQSGPPASDYEPLVYIRHRIEYDLVPTMVRAPIRVQSTYQLYLQPVGCRGLRNQCQCPLQQCHGSVQFLQPWQSSLRWWRHCKLRRFIYVWKPNFLNITVIQDTSYPDALVISSVVTEQNGEPLHTLILPGTLGTPFVLECAYGGNQFQASISLTDRVPPFQKQDC